MAYQGPAELATNYVLCAGRFRSECVYALCHAEDELLSLHVHYSSSKQSVQSLDQWDWRIGGWDQLKSDVVC